MVSSNLFKKESLNKGLGTMSRFSEKALVLLARYGIGCAPPEKKEELEKMIEESRCDEEFLKFLFPTAYTSIVKNSKDIITEEDVRKYFLFTHNKFAQKAGKEFCSVYLAEVEKCYRKECEVVHEKGRERIKCFDQLKPGDLVLVHLGYAVEKYDKNLHTW
jgi:hypothetical protein